MSDRQNDNIVSGYFEKCNKYKILRQQQFNDTGAQA
jgi:hypothetical protein